MGVSETRCVDNGSDTPGQPPRFLEQGYVGLLHVGPQSHRSNVLVVCVGRGVASRWGAGEGDPPWADCPSTTSSGTLPVK